MKQSTVQAIARAIATMVIVVVAVAGAGCEQPARPARVAYNAGVAAYKALLQRHSAITLGRHVPAIAAVLTRVELEYASGQAAETLAYHLDNAA